MHVMDEIKRQMKTLDTSFQNVRFAKGCTLGSIGCLAGPVAGSPIASSVFKNVRSLCVDVRNTDTVQAGGAVKLPGSATLTATIPVIPATPPALPGAAGAPQPVPSVGALAGAPRPYLNDQPLVYVDDLDKVRAERPFSPRSTTLTFKHRRSVPPKGNVHLWPQQCRRGRRR